MNIQRRLFFLSLFSLFFLLGFTQGRKSTALAAFLQSGELFASRAGQIDAGEKLAAPLPLPPGPNGEEQPGPAEQARPLPTPQPGEVGQLNILIIGIDHLQAPAPRLESLWLVMTLPDSPRLTLMPLFPFPDSASGQGAAPAYQFGLDADGRPDPAFLASLQTDGLWWSGYLLVDEIALIELVEFVNDTDIQNDSPLNGVLAVTGLPTPDEDARQALDGHIALAAELCRRTTRLSPAVDLAPLLALFPGHARTDLAPGDLAAAWKEMRSRGSGLACEFPSLPAQPLPQP
jgi:hypothetical protein